MIQQMDVNNVLFKFKLEILILITKLKKSKINNVTQN
jgi:hypothetical protein